MRWICLRKFEFSLYYRQVVEIKRVIAILEKATDAFRRLWSPESSSEASRCAIVQTHYQQATQIKKRFMEKHITEHGHLQDMIPTSPSAQEEELLDLPHPLLQGA